MMNDPGAQDSEYVNLFETFYDDVNQKLTVGVSRMNTLTVDSTLISRPGRCYDWLLDNHGEARICTVYDENVSSIYYLDPANGKWRKLTSWDGFAPPVTAMWPHAFGPDGTLYMAANAGHDTTGLYAYDLVNNRLADKPLLRLKGYDFAGDLVMDQNKLLGITYKNDAIGTLWFDPKLKAVQAAIDALLPNTINRVTPPRQAGSPWVLVAAYSDVQPVLYFVYNADSKEIRHVGSSHPHIDPAQMAHQDLVHYQAQDGLDIPAWLTLPQNKKKNLPLILLVHDGPNVRGDSWGWDPASQFLASRGYAVLAPEYRGSVGFGDKHFRAGWKQWGLKMQDDLADGVKWAIAQGIADPKRICIAGTGYGGYAVLMGLATNPDLYQCGIDSMGFTDLSLLYKDNWRYYSDASEEWRQYDLPVLVGDAEKDAEQLKNTSPVNLAHLIQHPVLMAYGGDDYHVPLVHGVRMRDALKANHKQYEWVEYQNEGHGWYLPETRYDFWGRVEKFLAKNIGDEAQK
jgi:dienelactone hydrolase